MKSVKKVIWPIMIWMNLDGTLIYTTSMQNHIKVKSTFWLEGHLARHFQWLASDSD